LSSDGHVLALAKKYIWWQTSSEAATWPERVIAQAMHFGDIDEANALVENLGSEVLGGVLQNAQAGWFDERSWYYWNMCLLLCASEDVAELPVRRFP
jgi:hypothetical protein